MNDVAGFVPCATVRNGWQGGNKVGFVDRFWAIV